jgi:alcohol dehydrogenase
MRYDADLNFVYAHTPKVAFGVNVVADLGTYAGEMGLSKAVVITDSFLAEKTDLLDRVKQTLGPLLAGVFTGVIPDPTAASMDAGAVYAGEQGADSLISLGGGSAIDTAKGIAVVLKEGGKILDHEGYHALEGPQTPHIAIPTTAGTGSEMTMVTVIKDPERKQKTFIGSFHLHPNLAILDPTLLTGLPPKLTAATGMDAMSHAVECQISSLGQPVSDAYGIEAIRIITNYLPRCLEKPDDLLARGRMQIAANMAGTAFSNAMCSLNHAMAHTLGARHGVHHGTANAILLPHTMRYFMDVSAVEFARVAVAMGIDTSGMSAEEAGNKAADQMEQFVEAIGLTDRLGDYGVTEDALAGLADVAMTDGTIIYSPKPVFEPQDIVEILRKVL